MLVSTFFNPFPPVCILLSFGLTLSKSLSALNGLPTAVVPPKQFTDDPLKLGTLGGAHGINQTCSHETRIWASAAARS
jgi:hypothetical protein